MKRENEQAQKTHYPGAHMCWGHDELTEMFKSPVPTLCRTCFKAIAGKQIQLVGVLILRVIAIHRRLMGVEKGTDNLTARVEELSNQIKKLKKREQRHDEKSSAQRQDPLSAASHRLQRGAGS